MIVPTHEQFRDYLFGNAPNPIVELSSGGASPRGAEPQTAEASGAPAAATQDVSQTEGAPGAPTQQQAAGPAAPAAPPQQPPTTTPLYGQQGSTAERLFSPLQQGIQQTQQAVGQLGQSFQQQAGPTGQTFESRGGQQAIGGYLDADFTSSTEREAARNRATGLLASSYQGPRELDRGQAARVGGDIGEYQTRAEALRSGSGLQTLLQRGVPGLTRGQARYEAQAVMQEPGYAQRAAQGAESAGQLVARLAEEDRRAREIAATRGAEEEEIARRARGEITGRRGAVETEIETRVQEERARQRAQRESYDKFLAGGDPLSLVGQPGVDFDPTRFQTPAGTLAGEARAQYAAIMAKYPELAGYDPLGLAIKKTGRERFAAVPGGGYGTLEQAVKRGKITREQYAQLTARQHELEAAGFSPRTTKQKEAGRFAEVAPLYGGPGETFEGSIYTPEDVRPFTSFQEGVTPGRENLASAGQRETFNRSNELLGEADRIEAAGEPYRAALIRAEVDRYLENVEATLTERGEKLDESSRRFRRAVHRQRGRAREATGGLSKATNVFGTGLGRIGTLPAPLMAGQMPTQPQPIRRPPSPPGAVYSGARGIPEGGAQVAPPTTLEPEPPIMEAGLEGYQPMTEEEYRRRRLATV